MLNRCAEVSFRNKVRNDGVFSKESSGLSTKTYGSRFLRRSRHTRPRLPHPRCPRRPQPIRSPRPRAPATRTVVLELALPPTLRLCVRAPRARNGCSSGRRARARTYWRPRSGSLWPRRPCAHRRGCLRPPDAGLRCRRGRGWR